MPTWPLYDHTSTTEPVQNTNNEPLRQSGYLRLKPKSSQKACEAIQWQSYVKSVCNPVRSCDRDFDMNSRPSPSLLPIYRLHCSTGRVRGARGVATCDAAPDGLKEVRTGKLTNFLFLDSANHCKDLLQEVPDYSRFRKSSCSQQLLNTVRKHLFLYLHGSKVLQAALDCLKIGSWESQATSTQPCFGV